MPEVTVVVVGGGPVGLITALGLARRGVDTMLIEARPQPSGSPRNNHHLYDDIYQWSALPHLDELGILPEMERTGVTEHLWCFRVLGNDERIQLDMAVLADEVERPYNIHLPDDRLARIVGTALEKLPNARLAWGTRAVGVTQGEKDVTVLAEGPDGMSEIRAQWVVGADGAHSTVRRALGMGLPGTTRPERLVATNIGFDLGQLGLSRTSYQLDPWNGALIGQLDAGGLWRYVYAESRLLPEETIKERMPAAFKAALGSDVDPQVRALSAYRVHERAVQSFRSRRVLLAGDAAHLTNPTLSLGLQGGLYDAFSLADALGAVINQGASDDLLDQWAQLRRRSFVESASPLSSDMMALVFHSGNEFRLDAELEDLRQAASSADGQRRVLKQLTGYDLLLPGGVVEAL